MTGQPRPPADRSRYEVPPEVAIEWEAIRAQLRKRRLDLGLRQADVSAAMGRSADFVSVLENQVSSPNVHTLMLWARALGGQLGVGFN